MAVIYLIRHGQASFGQDDYDCLSEQGTLQATHLGNSLAKRQITFDKVIIGGMLRHRQTADNCLQAMQHSGTAAVADDAWNEYDHQNILAQLDPQFASPQGLRHYVSKQDNPHLALDKIIGKAFTRWVGSENDQDYAESWTAYQDRIHSALTRLIKKSDDVKSIAVFSSGGPIALLSQQVLGVPAKNLMKLNWTLVNCGVTKLLSSRRGLTLSSLNEHTVFEGEFQNLISYK
jgi:broad specificity phosphatase PhoE